MDVKIKTERQTKEMVKETVFKEREKDLVYFLMIVCYIAFFYYQMCISWNGLGYVSDILNLNV